MKGFRDLTAWQQAMELVTGIYRVAREFPREETYGLTSQLRRAAVSVSSNIAEGYGRNSRNEFHQFLGHAKGSLCEVETQIEIAKTLGYLTAERASDMLGRIERLSRVLAGLRAWSVKKSN